MSEIHGVAHLSEPYCNTIVQEETSRLRGNYANESAQRDERELLLKCMGQSWRPHSQPAEKPEGQGQEHQAGAQNPCENAVASSRVELEAEQNAPQDWFLATQRDSPKCEVPSARAKRERRNNLEAKQSNNRKCDAAPLNQHDHNSEDGIKLLLGCERPGEE